MHIHVYIYTYICIHIYIYMYTYIHIYVYIYTHIHMYTYVYMHVHTCICVYILWTYRVLWKISKGVVALQTHQYRRKHHACATPNTSISFEILSSFHVTGICRICLIKCVVWKCVVYTDHHRKSYDTCCSVLQCVAVSALQCIAVRCNVLQCVAVCCSVLQCVVWVAVCRYHLHF